MEASDITKITGKTDFIVFLGALAEDFRSHNAEWHNLSVDKFLEACAAWVMESSRDPQCGIDWQSLDYQALARILYMGKRR